MLQLRAITKIYKTKGGADTKALDCVSLDFFETGMVFLLGKSGSGKSTLLNIAGGLDAPTEGEIVVMGKSSKDFSASDFDSYRNTCVGFVFQEYNVLNEFNVEENVALSLDLQGRNAENKERVRQILKEVELEPFAKRRPNTLSGGQKQRVAIARALVKNPKIIMADEPTGALDSATGRQVFDTLKKLSATRLVLVVSHDREFAEFYGDRIIELQDGKVISDVTKYRENAEKLDENITRIGENTLSVRSGAALSESAIRTIREFFARSGGEVLISAEQEEIASYRKINRIDAAGAKERFRKTQPEPAPADRNETVRFIRSRLPAKKALRIGASGLRLKPFRLLLTILLSAVAFCFFGLFSTLMLYNGDDVLERSFLASDCEYLTVGKTYSVTATYWREGEAIYTSVSKENALLTPEEVRTLGGETAVAALPFSYSPDNVSVSTERVYDYYVFQAAIDVSDSALGEKITAGDVPKGADEIAVSAYFADCMTRAELILTGNDGQTERFTPASPEQLIGKTLLIRGIPLTVCGIFDGGTISEPYAAYRNTTSFDLFTRLKMVTYLQSTLHLCILLSEDFRSEHAELLSSANSFENELRLTETYTLTNDRADIDAIAFCSQFALCSPQNPSVLFFGNAPSSLTGNRLVLPVRFFGGDWFLRKPLDQLSPEEQDEYETFLKNCELLLFGSAPETEEPGIAQNTVSEELDTAKKAAADYLSAQNLTVTLRSKTGTELLCEVVGLCTETKEIVYCSQELLDAVSVEWTEYKTNYVPEEDAVYSSVYLPFDKTSDGFRIATKNLFSEDAQTGISYSLTNSLYNEVQNVNSIVDTLWRVFLTVGLIFMVFASLLLFNFISVSIAGKKKEIGILRALGARGTDVFKIFFAESGIIVSICTLLALIATFASVSALNNTLRAELAIMVQIFLFGPLPILIMIGISAFVAVISTFLPVFLAARKKPVDSIRAL